MKEGIESHSWRKRRGWDIETDKNILSIAKQWDQFPE